MQKVTIFLFYENEIAFFSVLHNIVVTPLNQPWCGLHTHMHFWLELPSTDIKTQCISTTGYCNKQDAIGTKFRKSYSPGFLLSGQNTQCFKFRTMNWSWVYNVIGMKKLSDFNSHVGHRKPLWQKWDLIKYNRCMCTYCSVW